MERIARVRRIRSSVKHYDVIGVAGLVIGGVQPRRTVGAQSSSVQVTAVAPRTQRAQQRGVQSAAERARRPHGADDGAPDAVRMNERVTADAEVDAARNRARRAADDDRRPTELKTPTADARPRHRTVLFHHSAEKQPVGHINELHNTETVIVLNNVSYLKTTTT